MLKCYLFAANIKEQTWVQRTAGSKPREGVRIVASERLLPVGGQIVKDLVEGVFDQGRLGCPVGKLPGARVVRGTSRGEVGRAACKDPRAGEFLVAFAKGRVAAKGSRAFSLIASARLWSGSASAYLPWLT